MARRPTKPEETSPDPQWLPEGSVPPRTPPAEAADPADTSSWLAEDVSTATRVPATQEGDSATDWDVAGLPARRDVGETPVTAPDRGPAPDRAAEGEAKPARAAGPPAEGVRAEVQALRAELGEIRGRLDAAAERTSDRRRRSAQESERLAIDLREEIAQGRVHVETLLSDLRDELTQAQATLDRRERKVLGSFAKRLERAEAAISRLKGDAESTQALLSVLSERAGPPGRAPSDTGLVDLRSATFEELRSVGLSATQATRVLTYRDAHGFDSVDGLREVPGLPDALFQSVKASFTV